jgi:hypothetical protein
MVYTYKRVKYPGLIGVLKGLKQQVRDSYNFANGFIPYWVETPEQLFEFLKNVTTYKKDPEGNEVLQKMETLFGPNNYHGLSGRGDCDCFTIAALASFHALGFKNPVVILAGKTNQAPGHIYAGIQISPTQYLPFDLTNDTLGYERYYKYKQVLPFSY